MSLTDTDTPVTPDVPPDAQPPARGRGRGRRLLSWAGGHRIVTALVVVLLALSPVWVSFASALARPPGSLSARAAEWTRDHGGASFVAWVENLWYSHHQPPKGGKPPRGAIPAPTVSTIATTGSKGRGAAHLPPPATIPPVAEPAVPGEGEWHAAGRLVDGIPAVYQAFVRPDAVHTSLVEGVAWMDTRLLRATLYSGSYIPGHGPWADTAPITPTAAHSLVAAFNSGFRLQDADGGYMSEGRTVAPLRQGAASLVIYRDGSIDIGSWGSDVGPRPDVVAVRQNLHLMVDNGVVSPTVQSNGAWGPTLGSKVYVWRSGVGVTADGALVYAGGPGLNVPTLASLLARAGAVRAMELDINTTWVNFCTYSPSGQDAAATPADGTALLSSMSGGPSRYFTPAWNRDFITMSVADQPGPSRAPR